MAKVVLFSDLHAHPFKPYATVLANGMNSRLADAVSCIEQVHKHAVSVDADLVLFGGDMFHVRKTISVAAFNAVYEQMAQFAVSRIPVLMIHGNHDQADKAGDEYSIFAFRSFLTVVDKPGWNVVAGRSGTPYRVLGVPYTENVEHLRAVVHEPAPTHDPLSPAASPRIFLGHLGVQGAKVGADFVYTNPEDPTYEDLNPGAFDVGFLGHYHEYQHLSDSFHYIGAPLQHTWGDRGQPRGLIELDTETMQHKHVQLQAPRFAELEEEDVQHFMTHHPDSLQDNYVRVIAARPWEEGRREAWRQEVGARSVEVVPPRMMQSDQPSPRLAVSPSSSFSDLIGDYVESGLADLGSLDEEYLIQLGREILEEAGDQR